MATEHDPQRIARLLPFADALARIEALVKPVAPREVEAATALGRVLAKDVVASVTLPPVPRALRDGYAVCAETIGDAGAYAPTPFAVPPLRIDVGEPLPPDADAVAALDVVVPRAGRFEAVAPVAAGEGVLASGADLRNGDVLRRAGERLRPADIALLSVCGLGPLSVRTPQIGIVNMRGRGDTVVGAACSLLAAAITAAGGDARCEPGGLAGVLDRADHDAVMAIGGTGSGRADSSVHELARIGRVEFHGVALLPGETAAFGGVGATPVLLAPGRLDAALAVWLAMGRPMLARLVGGVEALPVTKAVLGRKIASPLGFTEVVPMRCRDGKAEPIASGYWPLSAIARADGWVMIAADSEGYPAGTEVVLRPWP